MLKIYNSLTKTKEEFQPITPGKVRLYVCGITVYDYCHIGHARSVIAFDVIVRYLRWRDFEVEHVRNITDVDDKIINRARENNETCDELTARFIDAMHEDDRALGITPPTHEPRATEYMSSIIQLIEDLIKQGYGYVADNGDVCFDVRRFKEYGKLSHRNIDDLIAGARVGVGDSKRDPLDFVLWKMSKPDEPQWDSPWGKGRPGWHIECSAMSTKLLGQPFDIHGGGMDLKFPHHENEIAQSEAAYSTDFAKTWMHIGLLQVNKEKMSKSLNNFFTIRDMLKEHHPEVLRYFMMSGHYRSPVSYSKDNLAQVRTSLEHLYIALRGLPEVGRDAAGDEYVEKFTQVMDDDFNTPEALAVLFEMARAINKLREQDKLDEAARLGASLKMLAETIGILQEDPELFLQGDVHDLDVEKVDQLIAARTQARSDKEWELADQLRGELTKMGVAIEDTPDGTIWRRE